MLGSQIHPQGSFSLRDFYKETVVLTFNMFPCPSKVQLNPVILKNIIKLKLVPRRRRVATSQSNVTTNVPKQERVHLVSELVSDRDTTSVCSTSEPQSLTEKMGPEKIADMAHKIPEGQSEENCVGTLKAKTFNIYQCGILHY